MLVNNVKKIILLPLIWLEVLVDITIFTVSFGKLNLDLLQKSLDFFTWLGWLD